MLPAETYTVIFGGDDKRQIHNKQCRNLCGNNMTKVIFFGQTRVKGQNFIHETVFEKTF